MTDRELMQQALEALHDPLSPTKRLKTITALRKALEQPAQQEPVARGEIRFYTDGVERQHWKVDNSIDFKDENGNVTMTLTPGEIEAPVGIYTRPQAREPLTDEQIDMLLQLTPIQAAYADLVALARTIEAAHGIGEKK